MAKKKKENRGGVRPGAGRPKINKEKKNITFRADVRIADLLKIRVNQLIAELEKGLDPTEATT